MVFYALSEAEGMDIKMTELEKKVYRDIQLEIFEHNKNAGIKCKVKNEHEFIKNLKNIEDLDEENALEIIEHIRDSIEDFFSYLYRLIPPTKRMVHYSEEILNKIELSAMKKEHTEILKKYEDAFLTGADMNIFLSNNIKEPQKPDFLLYAWHLYHLHMSGKFVGNMKQMKNNRSDTQLLCIINPNDVYFVDVIPHPRKPEEYFNIRSLEIILKNGWMGKIGFAEIEDMIPGTLEPKIRKDKDIFELYSRGGINILFEFQGKGYCSTNPMCLSRRPIDVSKELMKINKNICRLNDEKGEYKKFQLGCNREGKLLGLVEFEMPTGEIKKLNIF